MSLFDNAMKSIKDTVVSFGKNKESIFITQPSESRQVLDDAIEATRRTASDLINGERKIKDVIFVKDFSSQNQQLNDLIRLSNRIKSSTKKENLLRDIAFIKQGLAGENNTYYEIKNSFVPSLCLHDVRLDLGGHIAQFDFIIITHKFICVMETKKLNGNIFVNSDGDFIRIILDNQGRELRREGMYSPISQNERHIKILRDILTKEELCDGTTYKSLVVLANDKTIIDKENCTEHIKQLITRNDQIVNRLEKFSKESYNGKTNTEKQMWKTANYLNEYNKPLNTDYINKYKLTDTDFIDKVIESSCPKTKKDKAAKRKDPVTLTKQLKEFRLTTSRKEGIKAYMIFTDKQMEALIEAFPKNKIELGTIAGFSTLKIDKYGEEIIKIMHAK